MDVWSVLPFETGDKDPVPWHESERRQTKEYIVRGSKGASSRAQHPLPSDKEHGVWEGSPDHAQNCYASFGDRGTIATVDAFGNLMQLSRFLGKDVGKSGMLCIDRDWVSEPYQVRDRMDWLNDLTKNVQETRRFGIVFKGPLGEIMSKHNDPPRKQWLKWRWPRYEYGHSRDNHSRLPPASIVIQWMVHKGTVLQRTTVENQGEDALDVDFRFHNHILIRELDCFDADHAFNSAESDDKEYSYHIGPHNYSWVCVHEFPRANPPQDSSAKASPSRPFAAATVVSIFKNGEALEFSGMDPTERFSWSHNVKAGGKMELVIAFRLIRLPRPLESWENFVIPEREADFTEFLNQEPQVTDLFISKVGETGANITGPYTTPTGSPGKSPGNHIEFLVRRNLEHLLSVCAVPLAVPPLPSDGTLEQAQGDSSGRPVALTCGDISGHLISNSASFFAFAFLTEIAKRLQIKKRPRPHDEKGKYAEGSKEAETNMEVENLLSRIHSVCHGHLLWLQKAERMGNGCFAPNYYVTGEVIARSPDIWTWIAPEALTDTPFQLLKAARYSEMMQDQDGKIIARELVAEVLTEWLAALEKADKRGKFAWPHATKEDVKVFRLDDHLWIFFALKSYEKHLSPKKDSKAKLWRRWTEAPTRAGQGGQKFNADDMQLEILRRFTTEIGDERRRMLALSRSPRETRFLLHARDTAFFYGVEWDLLTKSIYSDLWNATLQVQPDHHENIDATWTTTLRYALAAAMGSMKHRMNEKTPEDLVQMALGVLFCVTGFNGVVPGETEEAFDAMEPIIFSEERYRHSYFHAGFEVPFLLLTYAGRINQVSSPSIASTQTIPKTYAGRPADNEDILNLLREISRKMSERNRSSAIKHHRLIMKKRIPFNSQIDSTSIVEIGDEWLFNYPAFFRDGSDKPIDYMAALITARDHMKDYSQMRVIQSAVENVADPDQLIARVEKIADALLNMRRIRVQRRTIQQTLLERHMRRRDTDIHVEILDTPKHKHLGKQRNTTNTDIHLAWNTNVDFWGHINSPRTAAKAKKRFVWLPRANRETALRCYFVAPPVENLALSMFFDRHANYEKYVFDGTTMVLNIWETELHLSFFLLVKPGVETVKGIPDRNERPWPGVRGKKIAKASVGFRFHGDFFDRYWTCHFIEYTCMKPPDHNERHDQEDVQNDDIPGGFPFDKSQEHREWRQRKVLEIHLFNRTLRTVLNETRKVIGEIKTALGVQRDSSSINFLNLTSHDYSASNTRWKEFQPILHLINDDIESTLAMVSKWSAREASRGQERPRWTRNDEGKYRAFIKKELSTSAEIISELEITHKGAQALEKSLDDSFDRWRESLSFSDNKNIMSFTYVTVIFLPLGFAASIFSMSAPPDSSLVGNMAACAAVALSITLIALVNAEGILTVADVLRIPLLALGSFITECTQIKGNNSCLIEPSEEIVADTPANSHEDEDGSTTGRGDQLSVGVPWQLWFWPAHIFFELPVQLLVSGFEILGWKPGVPRREARENEGEAEDLERGTPENQEMGEPEVPDEREPGVPEGREETKILKGVFIVGGLILSPLLLIAWFVQFVCVNGADLLGCLEERILQPLLKTQLITPDRFDTLAYFPLGARPFRQQEDTSKSSESRSKRFAKRFRKPRS